MPKPTMNDRIFADDFKPIPYWWETTPRPVLEDAPLPQHADVAIIGSGYTGLSAALELARAGRHVVVLDAEDAGWGCSSRNGGLISGGLKPDLATLTARHGRDAALAILGEGQNALQWVTDFVATEGIDCDFRVAGRFDGAHTPRQFERMAAALASRPKELAVRAHVVPRAEQHREIGSDFYHGGIVWEYHACLDPARYHQGLLERVQAAGATVIAQCRVNGIEGDGRGFRLRTAKGPLTASQVLVASNGYTGATSPWMRRRVIPIGSYMIATETLPADLMDRLMPTDRTYSDSRKVVYYYRPSPDRTRILFGGRVTTHETDPRYSTPLLYRDLTALFPELRDYRVSHGWMGFVAYTFRHLPSLGVQDGIHFALGYCGSGVAMAGYLGSRIARRMMGRADGATAFDGLPLPTRPFYDGRPWFLPPVVAWYRWMDRMPW